MPENNNNAKKSKLRIKIIQPTRIVINEECEHVIVPGFAGDFGVYPDHTPLITAIRPGVLTVFKLGENIVFAIHDGFVTVEKDVIRIVCEVIETTHEVDKGRAERAKKRAKERLATQSEDIDYRRAEAALSRSLARINSITGH